MSEQYKKCNLCPRNCLADRTSGAYGVCGRSSKIAVSLASLHMWEEPCISGENGSGTIFFKGCPLGCVFCQNYKISTDRMSQQDDSIENDAKYLTEMMLDLQDRGAHNVNLVTATHFTPTVIEAIKEARANGLSIPIVYNTSGYEKVETLKALCEYVDVYLTDLKYLSVDLAAKYSRARDYVDVAKRAVEEMVKQQPELVYDEYGLLQKGVIVRHLVLPGSECDSRRVVRYLHKHYKNNILLSIMNQYTPVRENEKYTELNRTVTEDEYDKVVNYAIELGVENAFIQEGETAMENFIPDF